MSYLRASWEHKFVEGDSKDYVYANSNPEYVEDYGDITNEGFVEIFANRFSSGDKLLDEYMLRKLAKKLKVKLRKKPLTNKQILERQEKKVKKLSKEMGW